MDERLQLYGMTERCLYKVDDSHTKRTFSVTISSASTKRRIAHNVKLPRKRRMPSLEFYKTGTTSALVSSGVNKVRPSRKMAVKAVKPLGTGLLTRTDPRAKNTGKKVDTCKIVESMDTCFLKNVDVQSVGKVKPHEIKQNKLVMKRQLEFNNKIPSSKRVKNSRESAICVSYTNEQCSNKLNQVQTSEHSFQTSPEVQDNSDNPATLLEKVRNSLLSDANVSKKSMKDPQINLNKEENKNKKEVEEEKGEKEVKKGEEKEEVKEEEEEKEEIKEEEEKEEVKEEEEEEEEKEEVKEGEEKEEVKEEEEKEEVKEEEEEEEEKEEVKEGEEVKEEEEKEEVKEEEEKEEVKEEEEKEEDDEEEKKKEREVKEDENKEEDENGEDGDTLEEYLLSTPQQKEARRLARMKQLKEMRTREMAESRHQRALKRRGEITPSKKSLNLSTKKVSWKGHNLISFFYYSPEPESSDNG